MTIVEQINTLKAELRALANAVAAGAPNEQTMLQTYGWNFPPVDKHDLSNMAINVVLLIESCDVELIERADLRFADYSRSISQFLSTSLQYLWNGNGSAAFPVYSALLQWISGEFLLYQKHLVDWEAVEGAQQIPLEFAKRLRSLRGRINALQTSGEKLDEQIKAINYAHDAALALPTDLESMSEARAEVAEMYSSVSQDQAKTALLLSQVSATMEVVRAMEAEATKLVEKTEDAYSAATTKGLGEAFQTRADALAKSTWAWVGGLTIALLAGAILGSYRVSVLQDLVVKNIDNQIVWLNLLLAFFSIAAPVWFAWIATKQIGHRFRLSEDYAFKASVAKAYEGYRREAARLDPAFANRLFSSALDRIGEAPIRFVEHETPGSPFHELLKMRWKASGKDFGSEGAAQTTSAKVAPDPGAVE